MLMANSLIENYRRYNRNDDNTVLIFAKAICGESKFREGNYLRSAADEPRPGDWFGFLVAAGAGQRAGVAHGSGNRYAVAQGGASGRRDGHRVRCTHFLNR